MAEQLDKAVRLAAMIEERARETLDPLNRRMAFDRWPAEFRAIMWQAVADIAAREAAEAYVRAENDVSSREPRTETRD